MDTAIEARLTNRGALACEPSGYLASTGRDCRSSSGPYGSPIALDALV